MRILLLTHAFNSLTQRLFVDLIRDGHEVSVEFDINDEVTREAVSLWQPDVLIAPFLKRAIPEDVWRSTLCWIVHPGIIGDRGPSALDWAILNGEPDWGVTLLQAEAEMDAGPIWASRTFPMRAASKGSLYRREVTEAAAASVAEAIAKLAQGGFVPTPLAEAAPLRIGELRPLCRQSDRAIDWQKDTTEQVLAKIRSADGMPGLLDRAGDQACYLFDADPAPGLSGPPGQWIARSGLTLARATTDGAVWIGHARVKAADAIKLPAAFALPEIAQDLARVERASGSGIIRYEEDPDGEIGLLHFPLYNGAFGTGHCQALAHAVRDAAERPTKVLCLMGGPDFWSNGLHLNLIENAGSAADESWANINAIDDLVLAILSCTTKHVIAGVQGNAGAGGVFMALAADEVVARNGVILNPHYKNMGNLYGSEYWTYLLPRRAGEEAAKKVTQARHPMGVDEAKELGLVDAIIETSDEAEFRAVICERAYAWLDQPDAEDLLAEKAERRAADEAEKPLSAYREAELSRMKMNFYGFDPSYHVARYNFVQKVAKSHTPRVIAPHRRKA
ncbi:MAG: enoyl-CoA hydratase-related protein [Magnetovibrionaceae bacterium]